MKMQTSSSGTLLLREVVPLDQELELGLMAGLIFYFLLSLKNQTNLWYPTVLIIVMSKKIETLRDMECGPQKAVKDLMSLTFLLV